MLLNEFFTVRPLNEGGNMFPDSADIPKAAAGTVLANLKKALPAELSSQAFATGSAGQKDVSGDMDVMLDNAAVLAWSGQQDQKAAKAALKAALEKAGLKTALSGISVHARVPMGDQFAQVDIMLVDDAATVSKLHQHDYAAMGSTYKGKHKHFILSSAAKAVKNEKYPNGLMWSAFQGLFSRGPDGKKADFITNDPDQIARMLLNPNASAKDLASPQSIVAAIPKAERAAKLAAAKADFDKEGIPLPESSMKISEATGQLKGTDVAKTVKPQPFTGSQPHPFRGMLVGDASKSPKQGMGAKTRIDPDLLNTLALKRIHDKEAEALKKPSEKSKSRKEVVSVYDIDIPDEYVKHYIDTGDKEFALSKSTKWHMVKMPNKFREIVSKDRKWKKIILQIWDLAKEVYRGKSIPQPPKAYPRSQNVSAARLAGLDIGEMRALVRELDLVLADYRKKYGIDIHGLRLPGYAPMENMSEDANPTDKITMDVPLFLRMMEYAKEDAKTDMDLHDVTERAIELMQSHDWLCMENYHELVGGKPTGGEQAAEGKIKGADGKACWDGYRYAGTVKGKDKCIPVKKSK